MLPGKKIADAALIVAALSGSIHAQSPVDAMPNFMESNLARVQGMLVQDEKRYGPESGELVRVAHQEPHAQIQSHFNHAIKAFVQDWGFDDYIEGKLNAIEFEVLDHVKTAFSQTKLGWDMRFLMAAQTASMAMYVPSHKSKHLTKSPTKSTNPCVYLKYHFHNPR